MTVGPFQSDRDSADEIRDQGVGAGYLGNLGGSNDPSKTAARLINFQKHEDTSSSPRARLTNTGHSRDSLVLDRVLRDGTQCLKETVSKNKWLEDVEGMIPKIGLWPPHSYIHTQVHVHLHIQVYPNT